MRDHLCGRLTSGWNENSPMTGRHEPPRSVADGRHGQEEKYTRCLGVLYWAGDSMLGQPQGPATIAFAYRDEQPHAALALWLAGGARCLSRTTIYDSGRNHVWAGSWVSPRANSLIPQKCATTRLYRRGKRDPRRRDEQACPFVFTRYILLRAAITKGRAARTKEHDSVYACSNALA